MTDPGAGATCFSLRRVNPLLGLVAVVKTAAGRALSADGQVWQLQVAAHPPRGLWSGGGEAGSLRYYRFGLWSRARGLTRVPLNPALDIGQMLAASQTLIAAVGAALPDLPFPLAAELERWLLDADGRPLALLATALDAQDLSAAPSLDWSAGGRGERPFHAPSLSARGPPAVAAGGPAPHAEFLEQAIRAAAGSPRRACWFRRLADGSGCPIQADKGSTGRNPPPDQPDAEVLDASAFPVLGLRRDWPDPLLRDLVADYIDWLSPYLLTLPDLDDDLRARLEQAAARHAPTLDALWRLYPRQLDPELIRRARVEAQLRRSGPETQAAN